MDYRRRKYPNVQKNEALSIILNVFYERERERERERDRERESSKFHFADSNSKIILEVWQKNGNVS